MLSTKSPALFILVSLLSVLMIALLHGIALTQTSDKRVKNYDECIRAGYPTANPYQLTQEQCWTTNYGFFFKGLKPTIKQGVYGRVILNTGDCSLRTVEPGLRGMLSMLFTRDSCHYELSIVAVFMSLVDLYLFRVTFWLPKCF